MKARVAAPLAVVALAAATGRADPPAGPADMTEAEAAVAKAASALDAVPTSDCASLCKALGSLETATKHLCALAKPGDAADQKRCSDAKTKLEEATKKVRAQCPACAPSPPSDVVATKPPTPKDTPTGGTDQDVPTKAEAVHATYGATPVYAVRYEPRTRFGLGWSPLRLVLAPRLFALSAEVVTLLPLSMRVDAALGRDEGRTAWELGLQPRFWFAGAPEHGLFVGVDVRRTEVPFPGDVHVNGWTLGPVLGVRWPLTRHLWLSGHAGPAFALGKEPEHRAVPRLDLSLGWWLY